MRRDLIRVMHHAPFVRHNGYGWPSCGTGAPQASPRVTEDEAKVTCKKCRKRIGLPDSFDACADSVDAKLTEIRSDLDLTRDHLLAPHAKEDAVDQQD